MTRYQKELRIALLKQAAEKIRRDAQLKRERQASKMTNWFAPFMRSSGGKL